ncbi:uncharacterized protein LOC105784851 [Gossypium raimondii]|uniref:uncharacterized protein LOC105784851 n=1 Tax=Gossypium raimondii TaxID=29730 RepID=UPI00063AFD51|nr:uncharacterized protein LOC105784851 [Gossypium raimondii]
MANEFLDKVEDNAIVHIWLENVQLEKGDSLAKGYVSELWDYTRISVTQNSLQELNEIWDRWNDETKQLFYTNYGDLPYLLNIKVDERLFRALAQYWNPAYSCFTFGNVDLVPTVEKYTALLYCPRLQVDKVYSRAAYVPAFWKKLMKHPDGKKKVDVFALSIYGLVIFPKALGHVDEAVSDLFDRLGKRVTPVPAILAETFRSLNACRRAGEGRFIGCTQLLIAWFHSHFWKVDKVSYRVFSGHYSPLKEIVAMPRRDDISEENWIAILSFDWVSLLGIWGAVGYAPLLVLRQYNSRQFVQATYGLAQCEFSYRGDNYKKKVKEISQAWNQVHRMKMLAVSDNSRVR